MTLTPRYIKILYVLGRPEAQKHGSPKSNEMVNVQLKTSGLLFSTKQENSPAKSRLAIQINPTANCISRPLTRF